MLSQSKNVDSDQNILLGFSLEFLSQECHRWNSAVKADFQNTCEGFFIFIFMSDKTWICPWPEAAGEEER